MTLPLMSSKTASNVMPEQQQSLIQALLFVALACFALIAHGILTAEVGVPGLLWMAGITCVAMFVSIEFTYALLMSALFLQNTFIALISPLIRNPENFSILLGGSFVNLFVA